MTLKRTLSIRVEAAIHSSDASRLPYKKNGIAIEFCFKRPSLEEEILLDQISIYDEESAKCLAKFQSLNTTQDPKTFSMDIRSSVDSFGILRSKLTAMKCVWLTAEPEYWKPEFEESKGKKDEILNHLKKD